MKFREAPGLPSSLLRWQLKEAFVSNGCFFFDGANIMEAEDPRIQSLHKWVDFIPDIP